MSALEQKTEHTRLKSIFKQTFPNQAEGEKKFLQFLINFYSLLSMLPICGFSSNLRWRAQKVNKEIQGLKRESVLMSKWSR